MKEKLTKGIVILIVGLILGIIGLSMIQYYNTTQGITSRMISEDAQILYLLSYVLLLFGGILFLSGLYHVFSTKTDDKPNLQYPVPPPQQNNSHEKKELTVSNKKELKTLKKSSSKSETPSFCKKCGHKLDEESIYCENCGEKVR